MLFTIYVAYLRLEIDIGFPLNRLEGAILCICFARGIYWDGFKAFRYISNLLYTSVFESVPFMIILMFSTVSFAITMDALAGEDNQVDFFD